MNPREAGFLLLTSHLGDPEARVLTVPQLRTLSRRMAMAQRPADNREMTEDDLMALGYDREFSLRVLGLLQRQARLHSYLKRGADRGCLSVTRVSGIYPAALRHSLGENCPGCLWAKGELSLLQTPCISLVGSRDLNSANAAFAEEAGRQAALQGLTLVSGNARGADRTAQNSCLSMGGRVISIISDRLDEKQAEPGILYLSEDGFDCGFSALRALSRNRLIHAMGALTLVAQCTCGSGGTWSGTLENLRRGYSPVACFRDGSEGIRELEQLGARGILPEQLQDLRKLAQPELRLPV